MSEKILEVKDLKTYFYIENRELKAVDGVSFSLKEGETLGIVGESGCGKSVTSLSIMKLLPKQAKIVSGEIVFQGRDLVKLGEPEMRKVRGGSISMIFQEPMTSLNPVFTVGSQVIESIVLHQKVSKEEARKKTIELFKACKIPDASLRINEYPHQLSGGMRQRVMIAMALSCNPRLLIADEPTTALDVTVQAQILELLKELQSRFNMAIIIISHDLGVIYQVADYVGVMYAGKMVEYAPKENLFQNPHHPYTFALNNSRPAYALENNSSLVSIPGDVPSPLNFPQGCRFHTRCSYAQDKCRTAVPEPEELKENELSACFYPLNNNGKE